MGTDQNTSTDYFSRLGAALDELMPAVRERVMVHVDYLAGKARVTSEAVLAGTSLSVDPVVLSDAMKNISAEIAAAADAHALKRPEKPRENKLAGTIPKVVSASQLLEGWCTLEKATALASLVLSERPEICVEIGVFGGRSLIPCAAALRHLGKGGVIYGVETWSAQAATEYATGEVNDEWWRKLDYARIKGEFLRFIVDYELTLQVRIVEARSADAVGLFPSIDFLHIDGAHSVFNAAEDVVLYLKRLRSGGVLVMDDVNWTTTAPAYEIIKSLCDPLSTIKDEAGIDACAILRKR